MRDLFGFLWPGAGYALALFAGFALASDVVRTGGPLVSPLLERGRLHDRHPVLSLGRCSWVAWLAVNAWVLASHPAQFLRAGMPSMTFDAMVFLTLAAYCFGQQPAVRAVIIAFAHGLPGLSSAADPAPLPAAPDPAVPDPPAPADPPPAPLPAPLAPAAEGDAEQDDEDTDGTSGTAPDGK